jgi:hypothetical protein
MKAERAMLFAFKERVGQKPYANGDGKRKRILCSN